MKNENMKKFYSAAFMSAALMVSALSFSACNESGSKGTKSAKSAELNCPELPQDPEATGEFDPIASKDARP